MELDDKNNIKDLIIPRSLWLEESKKESDETCIIIGINPGKLSKKENEIYSLNNGKSLFEKYEEFYVGLPNTKEKDHPYYHRLKRLAEKLGYENILWSNLCKCENNGKKLPPPSTINTCMNKYFQEEMRIFPKAPIIAAHSLVNKKVRKLYPDNLIYWVPHPTGRGSRHLFSRLFEKDNNKKLKKEYIDKLEKFNKIKNGKHIKIFPET